jgi:hypothetical protein
MSICVTSIGLDWVGHKNEWDNPIYVGFCTAVAGARSPPVIELQVLRGEDELQAFKPRPASSRWPSRWPYVGRVATSSAATAAPPVVRAAARTPTPPQQGTRSPRLARPDEAEVAATAMRAFVVCLDREAAEPAELLTMCAPGRDITRRRGWRAAARIDEEGAATASLRRRAGAWCGN